MLDLSIANVDYLNTMSYTNRKRALSSGCFEPAKRGRVPAHLKQEHLERKEYCKTLKRVIARHTREMAKLNKELAKAGKIKIRKEPAWYTKLMNEMNENPKNIKVKKNVKKVKAECPPGKERNPVTGRCRKVKSANPPNPPKPPKPPCKPGKERNPITGRCRKIK